MNKTPLTLLALITLSPFSLRAGNSYVVDFSSTYTSGSDGTNVNVITPTTSGSDDNVFTSYTSGPLKSYETGSTTAGVTLSISTSGGCTFWNDWSLSTYTWTGTTNEWLTSNLANDYIGANGGGATSTPTLTVTLNNLSAGSYKLYLVSTVDTGTFSSGYFYENISVTTGSGTVGTGYEAGGGTNSGTGWDAAGTGQGCYDYLVWELTLTASGSITITIQGLLDGGSCALALNGFYLESVPEPAVSAAIFGALALGGAWFIRRKKAVR